MRFLDGQLQGRNGRNPFGIFNLLRFWRNAFGNGTAIAVQPSELQKSNFQCDQCVSNREYCTAVFENHRKVFFDIASEVYYILSFNGELIKSIKNGPIWRLFST